MKVRGDPDIEQIIRERAFKPEVHAVLLEVVRIGQAADDGEVVAVAVLRLEVGAEAPEGALGAEIGAEAEAELGHTLRHRQRAIVLANWIGIDVVEAAGVDGRLVRSVPIAVVVVVPAGVTLVSFIIFAAALVVATVVIATTIVVAAPLRVRAVAMPAHVRNTESHHERGLHRA